MIEILNKKDINNVRDEELKNYLYKSFDRLTEEFNYPNDGYFVIIEKLDEIKSTPISLSACQLNCLNTGLYDDINMVEITDKIVEILVFIDNDINISFIIKQSLLDDTILKTLQNYTI